MTISIRQRLTLWYTAAAAVLLATSALGLIVIHWRLSLERLDAELARLNATLASVLTHELSEGLGPEAAAKDCLDEIAAEGRHLAILSRDGRVLDARWTLPSAPPVLEAGAVTHTWIESSPAAFRVVSSSDFPVPNGFMIATAASSTELNADRDMMIRALVLVLPPVLLVAAAGMWLIAGRALKPASDLADQARRITEDSSGARLTVSRRDELGHLATAFNGLLDRLDAALDVRRRFLAETSHELRTPVSIARTAADVALSREGRSEAEYRDSLTVVAEQMKRLGRMVSDMLALARTDAADWPIVPGDFYFDEVVTEVGRSARLLAKPRDVAVEATCPSDLQVRGDEDLLRQMLLNVVENAVRHTPAGGTVRVTAGPERGKLGVVIQDTGAGIPESDRDRIFDRFTRIGPAAAGAGMGLGLAIARRIARAHGGDLTLAASGPTGSTFQVLLPMSR